MAIERTFVMIKPDAVQRGLIGKVISRLENKGLKIIAMKFMAVPKDLAERHYAEHRGKEFYNELIEFITSGPVVAMVWEGENAISVVRAMMGATDPQKSPPGSIRGDFGMTLRHNIVHGSDSSESAEREIALWFSSDEMVEWQRDTDKWI